MKFFPRLLSFGLILLLFGGEASAQAPWQFDPYRVLVITAGDGSPLVDQSLLANLRRDLLARADATGKGAWRVEAQAASKRESLLLVSRWNELASDEIASLLETYSHDKIILLSVSRQFGQWQIRAREWDAATRQLSPAQTRRFASPALLAAEAFSALANVFRPLVRIERVEGENVEILPRADQLIEPDSPPALAAGALLQPVVRRTNRLGRADAGGIRAPPWTFLALQENEAGDYRCKLHSGLASPLGGRSSQRTQRLAILAPPANGATTLQLLESGSNSPLAGYEVYIRGAEEQESAAPPLQSDSTGRITVAAAGELKILYVRSGNRLLARLPVVAGIESHQTAYLPADDTRLAAEGFVAGVQSRMMDLVAQRQVLAASIRRRIGQGELAEAEELLNSLRGMEGRSQLLRQLDGYQQRLKSSDAVEQARIDQIFTDARKVLGQFLDPKLGSDLQAELKKAS